jgi:hypothetical protein
MLQPPTHARTRVSLHGARHTLRTSHAHVTRARHRPISRPLPTVTPINSSRPFPATASTSSKEKNPIMAARLFNTSAFSTKPNLGGGVTGERGGCDTPLGGAANGTMAACRPAPTERMPCRAVDLDVLNMLVRCIEAAGLQKETHDMFAAFLEENSSRARSVECARAAVWSASRMK